MMSESEIERAYDRSPYPAFSFDLTHPDYLGMVGRLFGLATADPETCSVLEIGCAVGGNLIPMAIGAPRARLVGIDISGVHIEQARASAAACRVDNVTFYKGDFRELPAALGRFDYIICHGVFAWVTPETQEALLAFIGERLAPDGVAFVSYNAYPGHHMVDMVRKLIRVHATGAPDTAARDAQAFSILRFLKQHARTSPKDWRAGFLEHELAFMQEASPSLIEHDYFAVESHPVYFVDFVARAARSGLAYLADSVPWLMYLENQSAEIQETFGAVEDIVLQGQYLDFLHNTRYRETLLCRRGARVSRDLDPARVRDLHVTSLVELEPTLEGIAEGRPLELGLTRGGTLSVKHPALKLALRRLWQRQFATVSFAELAREVEADLESIGQHDLRGEALAQRLAETLLRTYFACAVRFRVRARPIAYTLPERPATGRYQRHLAAARAPRVSNLANATISGVPVLYELLPAMDGSRTVEELQAFHDGPIVEALEQLCHNGFVLDPAAVQQYG